MRPNLHFYSTTCLSTRLLIGAGFIISLVACGGGTADPANADVLASRGVKTRVAVPNTAGAPAPLDAAALIAANWLTCAWEGGACEFSGSKLVRYGADGSYVYRSATGSVACRNEVFGDPAVGTRKTCALMIPGEKEVPLPPIVEVLPVPTDIASGSTVNLECGKIYQGTLELNGKSNVTVQTVGSCGKAAISPGRAITGWVRDSGDVYSAPIDFTAVQVAIGGVAVSTAHWPNLPWATSTDRIPSSDLNGATQVYLANQSVIRSRKLTSANVDTANKYYLEGKLWMLDSPGEWAVHEGRLYLWAADGQSPEGRVWASPDSNGINADKSSDITVDGIRIFSATDGISAHDSRTLKVLNTDIDNSARDGIWAVGSNGMQVNLSNVSNARRNGIDGYNWVVGAVITNSSVTNTGMVGMPSETDAGIMFGDGYDNRIDNVHVTNSGYHGISMLHNRRSQLLNSFVDLACVRLTDCGAVYTGARDQLPLSLLIEGNTITNTKGSEGIGIYLDDFANGVTVNLNKVSGNTRAMSVHNGFDNVITNNTFASSTVAHIGFGQGNGNIHNNQVSGNTFESTNGEQTYNMEAGSNLTTFITADYNTYRSTDVNVFHRAWDGISDGVTRSYSSWKEWSGLDANSTMNGSR